MKRLMYWITVAALSLAASLAGAAELLLGPGDVVKASVYGSPDLAIETRVSESGMLTFPLLGQVQVGGLSTQQAEKKIGGLLEKGGYLKKAQVNLLVTMLASQQVSVLGQVNKPGRYPVDGTRKVLDLLALAGGIGPEGGDIIFVERAPRAWITGEVQRPGPFRIERAMTVQQALSAGGGLTMRGTQRGLEVTRRDANGVPRTIDAKTDDLVQVDDVITVRESWF